MGTGSPDSDHDICLALGEGPLLTMGKFETAKLGQARRLVNAGARHCIRSSQRESGAYRLGRLSR